MWYLKKYVKFRKEEDYVLMCDCSSIQNYELPLSSYDFLNILKKGYNPYNPLGFENEESIFLDLKDLGLIDTKLNSNSGFHDKQWINLDYDESEFFQ